MTGLADTPEAAQRIAYRSGVPPASRSNRTVHNPDLPSVHLALSFNATKADTLVTLNISNFADTEMADFTIDLQGATLNPQDVPTVVPANSFALASWQLHPSPDSACALTPLTMTLTHTDPSTTQVKTISIVGTPPGPIITSDQSLPYVFNVSSASPSNATFHSLNCAEDNSTLYAIRAGGRGVHPPFDDFSALYLPNAFGSAGNITVSVRHIDTVTPGAFAGLVLRNQLGLNTNGTNNFTGYAAVVFDAQGRVGFGYDGGYKRVLNEWRYVENVASLSSGVLDKPVWLRLGVQGVTVTGYVSRDEGQTWEIIGDRGFVMQSHWAFSHGGMIAGSGGGWRMGTAVFGDFEVGGKEVKAPSKGKDEL